MKAEAAVVPRVGGSRDLKEAFVGRFATGRKVALATAISGTLDIAMAIGLTVLYDRDVAAMLRGVASGPFPPATGWGNAGAALGLVVHYTLMAIMAAIYMLAARRAPVLRDHPIAAGVAYGILTYVAMNWIVVPLRFGVFPDSAIAIGSQLFSHIVLVGLPFAFIARR
jgi:hypothetical protein